MLPLPRTYNTSSCYRCTEGHLRRSLLVFQTKHSFSLSAFLSFPPRTPWLASRTHDSRSTAGDQKQKRKKRNQERKNKVGESEAPQEAANDGTNGLGAWGSLASFNAAQHVFLREKVERSKMKYYCGRKRFSGVKLYIVVLPFLFFFLLRNNANSAILRDSYLARLADETAFLPFFFFFRLLPRFCNDK